MKKSSNINNSNSTSPCPLGKSPTLNDNETSQALQLQRIKALTVGIQETNSSPPTSTNPIMAMENLVKSHMAR